MDLFEAFKNLTEVSYKLSKNKIKFQSEIKFLLLKINFSFSRLFELHKFLQFLCSYSLLNRRRVLGCLEGGEVDSQDLSSPIPCQFHRRQGKI